MDGTRPWRDTMFWHKLPSAILHQAWTFWKSGDPRKGGFQSAPFRWRTRDRCSLMANRRVFLGARLFLASCDSRNVLVARVTALSPAMFDGSPRFLQTEQLNRILL